MFLTNIFHFREKTMDVQNIFGSLTLLFGVLAGVFGLSSQALKNYKEKKCGMPLSLMILVLGVYLSRSGYAISIASYYILIPDVIGTFASIILGN